ncbi:MAG TPA: GatB/YqeY domain-containing protein [Saprospiraceae bacterium]|nr:GatB/YqeY domain-containing protein [Saprospiraceae bacterium]HPN69926.1 GatB/YqeY domain-containing protein [Saprospiraceae bacterium]
MSLETKLMEDLKVAMKSKDQAALRGIRAIKSAILLFKTDGSGNVLDEAAEIKLVQKLVKQRQDSLAIYIEQNREDLAKVEQEEIGILMNYLPEQLSEEKLEGIIAEIIQESGATSVKDMGKVMGLANQKLSGKADGKTISAIVKKLLA